jgi:hypothetical protein
MDLVNLDICLIKPPFYFFILPFEHMAIALSLSNVLVEVKHLLIRSLLDITLLLNYFFVRSVTEFRESANLLAHVLYLGYTLLTHFSYVLNIYILEENLALEFVHSILILKLSLFANGFIVSYSFENHVKHSILALVLLKASFHFLKSR